MLGNMYHDFLNINAYQTIIQTDIIVLNLVIYPKLKMVRHTSNLWRQYDLNEIQLTKKEDSLEWKYFTGSMPLLQCQDFQLYHTS